MLHGYSCSLFYASSELYYGFQREQYALCERDRGLGAGG